MLEREGVFKIEYGDEQADKLSESDNQRYDQRGTLRGQHKHASNAHILCDAVTQNVQPQLWQTKSSDGNLLYRDQRKYK